MSTNNGYPPEYETQVLLKDGSSIQLRPIHPDDAEACLKLFQRDSDRNKLLQSGHSHGLTDAESIKRFCTIDYITTLALVAEVLRDGSKDIVGIGRYYRLPGKNSAEVFVLTDEKYQGKGLGTAIIEKLAAAARSQGISLFEADVQVENEPALSLLNGFGFHITKILEKNIYHVNMPIMPTWTSIRREEERESLATVASIKSIFYPRSIAVIGASRHPGTIGYLLVRDLIESGFTGAVYPVNPNIDVVSSIKAYPSVLAIPGEIDMAIIVVPGKLVSKVVEECGRKRLRSLIVISDGFKESGPEGAIRERELREIAFGHGMRVVGPNCMGVINTDATVSMNATFCSTYPSMGNVSFLSQSGAMGVVILEYPRSINIGLASFISIGNRADISPNDLIQYWEQTHEPKLFCFI